MDEKKYKLISVRKGKTKYGKRIIEKVLHLDHTRISGNVFTLSNVYIVDLHNRYRTHSGFHLQARIVYRECSEIKKKKKEGENGHRSIAVILCIY